MATVILPQSLLALFPGLPKRHEIDAADVAAIIDSLDARSPGLRDRLVENGPRLRRHINVFVGGRPGDLTTPVEPTDTIHILPAMSGG